MPGWLFPGDRISGLTPRPAPGRFFCFQACSLGSILGMVAAGAHFYQFRIKVGEDFDEVGLGGHGSLDVLVEGGNFVPAGERRVTPRSRRNATPN